jgi:hypothetical protein
VERDTKKQERVSIGEEQAREATRMAVVCNEKQVIKGLTSSIPSVDRKAKANNTTTRMSTNSDGRTGK